MNGSERASQHFFAVEKMGEVASRVIFARNNTRNLFQLEKNHRGIFYW